MEIILALVQAGPAALSDTIGGVGLPTVCAVAFISVMTLLAFQALIIRAITLIFPPENFEPEPAVETAIRQAVEKAIPDARIVSIRTIKK